MSYPTERIIKHFPPRANKRHRRQFVEWVIECLRAQGSTLPASPTYAELKAAIRRDGIDAGPDA